MSTQIKGSILEMTLGKRTGGKIQKTGTKDYIRYKEKEESDAVTLTSKYTDTYWTQLYFKIPELCIHSGSSRSSLNKNYGK